MKQFYYTNQNYFPLSEPTKLLDKDLSNAGYLYKTYNEKPLLFCADEEAGEFKTELENVLKDKVILKKVTGE